MTSPEPPHIFVRFDVTATDRPSADTLMGEWLNGVMPTLDRASFEVASLEPDKIRWRPPRGPEILSADDVWGEPDGAIIQGWVSGGSSPGSRRFPGSRDQILRTWSSLAVGETLHLDFQALDSGGRPVRLGSSGQLAFSKQLEGPDGVTAGLSAGTGYWRRLFDAIDTIRDLVSGWSVVRGFGGIRPDVFAEQWAATFGVDEAAFRARTDVVTGYNWLTVVSPELTAGVSRDQLAFGVEHLAECEVSRSGSLWLRACTDPRAYDLDSARSMVHVLSSVLPAGQPSPSWIPQAYAPLVTDHESAST